jgi:hypothetical protein
VLNEGNTAKIGAFGDALRLHWSLGGQSPAFEIEPGNLVHRVEMRVATSTGQRKGRAINRLMLWKLSVCPQRSQWMIMDVLAVILRN